MKIKKLARYALAGLLVVYNPAFAQKNSIEMVVGLAPGGAGDISARMVARYLEKHIEQPIVVVNKPGAGQMIAASSLAKSPANGAMIGYMTNAIITSELSGMAKGAYQTKDLAPVCQINASGSVLVVRADLPVNSYESLERYAKNNSLTAGHQGNGSANHMRLSALSKFRDFPMVMVPYRGEADVMTNLLGKHIDIAAVSPTTALNNIKGGQIRVVMAWGDHPDGDFGGKLPLIRDIDKNVPDVNVKTYIWTSANAPKEFIKRLETGCNILSKDTEFSNLFTQSGFELVYRNSQEAANDIQSDKRNFVELLKLVDITK